MRDKSRLFGLGALFAASLIVACGTLWAFTRGGRDFAVFFEASRFVLQGRGAEIYHTQVMPDRFLYAPGFAWLFSPLALLPKSVALAIWCFAKAAIVGLLLREFSGSRGLGWAALGICLLARPLLIDLEYGQVNLLILGACVWPLVRYFDERRAPGWADTLSWGLLGCAAVTKLFPLPLLLIPFVTAGPKRGRACAGALAGVLLVAVLPLFTQGWEGTLALYSDWRLALLDRGLPLESHNQSFSAFLHHYFSDEPTQIIAQHRHALSLGIASLSGQTIELLTAAWGLVVGAVIVSLILFKKLPVPNWIALLVGLLIVPSHLVWKPYFVFGLPAAILLTRELPRRWPLLLGLFALINFSGFDFLGEALGARFEAGAILLWAHLALLKLII